MLSMQSVQVGQATNVLSGGHVPDLPLLLQVDANT